MVGRIVTTISRRWSGTVIAAITATILTISTAGCGTQLHDAFESESHPADMSQTRRPTATDDGNKKTDGKHKTSNGETTGQSAEQQTTVAQVHEHASQIAHRYSDQMSYTVPGDQESVYSLIVMNGDALNALGQEDAGNRLSDLIKDSLVWSDSHSSSENQQRIRDLDSAYAAWVVTLWRTMGYCLKDTVEGLDAQLKTISSTYGTINSCAEGQKRVGAMPDTDTETEQEYIALRDWMNNAIDQMNQCQADLAETYGTAR